jgi:site-specific recombinase XerD
VFKNASIQLNEIKTNIAEDTSLDSFFVRGGNSLKKDDVPQIVKDFMVSMTAKGYSTNTPMVKDACRFLRFWRDKHNPKLSLHELEMPRLPLSIVREYEEHLITRLSLKEISEAYVYQCSFRYKMPANIHSQGNRDNDYIPIQDVMKMIKTVHSTSRNKYRDLSILLMLIELGCRPIEISTIIIDDINLIERTVTVFSLKSGQRVLKISPTLKTLLKKYIEKRNALSVTHSELFLTCYKEPVCSGTIQSLVHVVCLNTFGDSRYSAKFFRHTYATNALEDGNAFDEVVDSMGHLHWVSTMYYLHKNKERLLANSLPFNPLKSLEVKLDGNPD